MLSNPAAQRYRDNHPERDRQQRREANKRWRLKNLDKVALYRYFHNLFRKYKVTREFYETLLVAQDYKCKICGKLHEWTKYGKLNVDHDHETGEIRGLLCNECNRGLGQFKDSIELFWKAIDYLAGHEVTHE